jgi:hypothetical protein
MKTGALILLSLVASASAFTSPMLATRAVKAPAKKAAGTKVVAKAPAKKGAKKEPAKKEPAKKEPAKKPLFQLPVKKVAKKEPAKKEPAKKAPVKKVVKKAPAKKAVKAAAPAVKKPLRPKTKSQSGYVLFEGASKFKIKGISGGGNNKPIPVFLPPDFSDPKLQIYRDPKFYADAAKKRLTKNKTEFVYEDGLTVLEREQKKKASYFPYGIGEESN